MITVNQIAHQVRRDLTGGDTSKDSNFNIEYIKIRARQGLNKLLKLAIYEKRNNFDRSAVTQYIATYPNLDVEEDTDRGEPYLDIPEFYQSLPHNKGIYAVCPNDNHQEPLIRRNFQSVSYGLPCYHLEGKKGYYVEGMRIYFDKDFDDGKATLKLIVAAPDKFGDDDPLPILPEQQFDLIDMVKASMAERPLEDKINDGNPDIGVKV